MKRLLIFLFLTPIFVLGQVPQGIGYQGVATDAFGVELINQSISIRASILNASANGNIQWQETHNTSTDTFGLFNLAIGLGTSTGNGSLANFSDISWGAQTHFLKIEMDVNAGTNYSNMGTNQMMSVPYALYSENTNINYNAISTLLSNDSMFINTVADSISTLLSIDSTFLTTINVGSGDDINLTLGNRYSINIDWSARSNSPAYMFPIGTATIDYVATNDGFITGTALCTGPGFVYFHSDTISSPQIIRGKMTAGQYGDFKSFCFVLKKGETFRFTRYAIVHSIGQPWSFYGDVSDCYFTEINSSTFSSSTIDSLLQVVSNLDSSIYVLNSQFNFGCTDNVACNYDAIANIDNGSCILPNGCTDTNAINYDSTATCDDGSCVSAIGQSYQGGVIAYIDNTGLHGLILSSDIGNASWGCYGIDLPGADGTIIGSGNQNTIDIINGCTDTTAASLCENLVINSYSDWFLPSKDALYQIYTNRVALGIANTATHWSSSEVDATGAWLQIFSNGSQQNGSKGNVYPVRAVRTF